MKFQQNLILIAFFLSSSFCSFSQNDTIHLENGNYKIIFSGYANTVLAKEAIDKGLYFISEHEGYNKNGVKISETKYFNDIHHRKDVQWNDNGKKIYETYENGALEYFHTEEWDEDGWKQKNDVIIGGNRIFEKYYEKSIIPKEVIKFERIKSNYDSLKFIDENGYYWEELNIPDEMFYITRINTFYKNGKLKTIETYKDKVFEVYKSKDDRNSIVKDINKECRDGEWFYYNEEGILIKREFYESCRLKTTIEEK